MSGLLHLALDISLGVHIFLIAVCVWRVWRGENVIDRLIAADLVGILTLAVLVLFSIIQRVSIYIDVALGLAGLGAAASVVLARYIAVKSRA